MRKEFENFLLQVRNMADADVGMLLAMAINQRNTLEELGYNVSDPIIYYHQNPNICLFLNGIIRDFQKKREPQDAAATMVWLFTMRAAASLELRQLGKELWKELERGIPYIFESKETVEIITGEELIIEGFLEIPIGMEERET